MVFLKSDGAFFVRQELISFARKIMTPIEIHQAKYSQYSQIWGAVIISVVMVVFNFFVVSALAGIFMLVVVAIVWIISFPWIKSFVDNPPVVIVLNEIGVSINQDSSAGTHLPWQDIEEIGLSHGGKSGIWLNFRVKQPEKYLSKFERIIRTLSRFHISANVSELEYSPSQILKMIEEARRKYA